MPTGYNATDVGDVPTEWIEVVRARTHNLNDVTVRIPRGRIVAFTGVSGSGKTSLVIDTVHAEAQLRYLEGLSPFVRQYVKPKDRPQVDRIDGLGATLAVDQRRLNRNSRSTVGSMTGIDAYLGMLYSRLPAVTPDMPEKWKQLSSAHFSRHSPEGSCPVCHGSGGTLHADPDLVITRPDLPLLSGASPWFDKLRSPEQAAVPFLAERYGVDLDQPWRDLPDNFRDALLYGTGAEPVNVSITVPNKNSSAEWVYQLSKPLQGAIAEVERLFANASTENAKQRYVRYLRRIACAECEGTEFGTVARTVTLAGFTYYEVINRRIGDLPEWITALDGQLSGVGREVGAVLLPEVTNRLQLLQRLGLTHLELARTAPSLSGGELQRARTAAQLSTALTGIVFVLDELSSGLHPADKEQLSEILIGLRNGGNTVLLVEHDPDVVAHADWVVDLGPGAGREGGRVVFTGPPAALGASPNSVMGRYLDRTHPRVLRKRRDPTGRDPMVLEHVRVHNVHIDEVRIPLHVLTCLSGVSGSGKSSLLNHALVPAVATALRGGSHESVGAVHGVGALAWLEVVDQDPIGRTPRSNPATYTKAFDMIRRLFVATEQSKALGIGASAYSFNATGGRCEACVGYGKRLVDMHFLPDVWATCDVCQGRRFGPEVLSVSYRGLAIDQVLDLTVDEAVEVFTDPPALVSVLRALRQVGLGYLQLGQSAPDLSGGEAQRLKLATAMYRGGRGRRGGLVVLDEPLTGLHPADVQRIVDAFDSLLDDGNTVVVAEHDLHLAAGADWVIELGPGAGDHGGRIVAQGPPERVRDADTPTGGYLRCLNETIMP